MPKYLIYLLLLDRAPTDSTSLGNNEICYGDFQALYSWAMENKLGRLWRLVASGVSLGPGDTVKPPPPPSVALCLQFFWKPVQKKRMTRENILATKQKIRNSNQTSSHKELGVLLDQSSLERLQQMHRFNSLTMLRYDGAGRVAGQAASTGAADPFDLRRQRLFQGSVWAYSALLVPQCWSDLQRTLRFWLQRV